MSTAIEGMIPGEPALIGAAEASDRSRVVIRWVSRPDGRRVTTITRQWRRRAQDAWTDGRSLELEHAELWLVRDALDRACALAERERR